MVGRYISSHLIDDINVQEVQFLGQRSSEAVGAAEAAGHHVPDHNPEDLPF